MEYSATYPVLKVTHMNAFMNKYSLLWAIIVTVFLGSCSSPSILITSNKHYFPLHQSRIMTVGVIKDDNDSIRISIEKNISAELEGLGYNAVSALEQFGHGGLANLDQHETYVKLCNEGIDAIIVVALIDKAKEKQFRTHRSYAYTNSYYYNRIWNYKNIQADLVDSNQNMKTDYFWEAILFNLSTLEVGCTIQSSSFSSPENKIAGQFDKQIVRKMVKEKVLKKQNIEKLKAF